MVELFPLDTTQHSSLIFSIEIIKLVEITMNFTTRAVRPVIAYAGAFQRVPFMTKEEVRAILEVAKSPKAPQVKPEDFYDNSFLQKLEVSDFINSLYPR
jgi:hypothetical protein